MQEQIKAIKDLIGGDKIEEALKELKSVVIYSNTLYDSMIFLERQAKALVKEHEAGLLTREVFQVDRNRVTKQLLDFIQELQDPDRHREIPLAEVQIQISLILNYARKNRMPESFLAILQNYNQLLDHQLKNIIDWEKYQEEMSALKDQLDGLINQLNLGGKVGEIPKQGIEFPILVIANKKEDKAKLEDYFVKVSIRGAVVETWSEDLEFDGYEIVVFDNTDLMGEKAAEQDGHADKERVARNSRVTNMNKCLKKSDAYLFHYGNQLLWIEKHRDRVHAANSKFALYNRIVEMISFIRAFSFETEQSN